MTGPEACKIIEKLGLSRREFGRIAGISPNALQGWADGRTTPLGPAQAFLGLLEARPELVEVAQRLARDRMLNATLDPARKSPDFEE